MNKFNLNTIKDGIASFRLPSPFRKNLVGKKDLEIGNAVANLFSSKSYYIDPKLVFKDLTLLTRRPRDGLVDIRGVVSGISDIDINGKNYKIYKFEDVHGNTAYLKSPIEIDNLNIGDTVAVYNAYLVNSDKERKEIYLRTTWRSIVVIISKGIIVTKFSKKEENEQKQIRDERNAHSEESNRSPIRGDPEDKGNDDNNTNK
ncbi:MAG: hypothetical protein ARM1_0574 [Candidatus Micrarchaeota archaeon]|nr:MAG: hypothetical protein ARM1_0574 [Candidatus Micrarchaeota archaeon]